jgi:hypothetical protein
MLSQRHYAVDSEEVSRLERLFGAALLDDTLCERLVRERDRSLLVEFGISPRVQSWLCATRADTLPELARALLPAAQ